MLPHPSYFYIDRTVLVASGDLCNREQDVCENPREGFWRVEASSKQGLITKMMNHITDQIKLLYLHSDNADTCGYDNDGC